MRADVQNQQAVRRTEGGGFRWPFGGGKRGNVTQTGTADADGAVDLRKPEERHEAAPAERMSHEDSAPASMLSQEEIERLMGGNLGEAFNGDDRAALQWVREYVDACRESGVHELPHWVVSLGQVLRHTRERQDMSMRVLLAFAEDVLGEDKYPESKTAKVWNEVSGQWCQDPTTAGTASEDAGE